VKEELSTELYTDAEAFPALKPEWNSLLRRSGTNTVFLSWEWQRTWWDWFGQELELRIVAIRDGAELIGLAPLYSLLDGESEIALRLIGGIDLSDYLDMIVVADGRDAAVYDALWHFLTEERSDCWDVLDLHNVPASSQTLGMLSALATTSGRVEVTSRVEEVCPVITLPATWDQYLSSLKKKQRHEIRRKIRKANREAAVDWYYVDDLTTLDSEVEDFVALHRHSGTHKRDFMDERTQGFFRAIAGEALGRGWLRLAFLVINDTKAAAMFCFDFNDSFQVYNSGYDPDLYASLSTGIVLLSYCIRDAIERGCRTFDFLRGEEEYKYRFGGVRTEIHNLKLAKRRNSHV